MSYSQPEQPHYSVVEPGLPAFERAVELTAQGFRQEVSEELELDVKNHLHGDILRRITLGPDTIGYAVFQNHAIDLERRSVSVLYLAGLIISPDHQGQHISQRVIDDAVKEGCPDYFGFRTQSSIMYAAALQRFREIYPSLDGSPISPEDYSVGSALAQRINSSFPLHRACYGGPLYGDKPLHRNAVLQAQFDQLCPDYKAGDAILCVAKVNDERQTPGDIETVTVRTATKTEWRMLAVRV
jgi:hypothetical protein